MPSNDVHSEELRNECALVMFGVGSYDEMKSGHRAVDNMVKLISTHTANAVQEALVMQLDFLISHVSPIILRGYGGEDRGSLQVLSLMQLQKFRDDQESDRIQSLTNDSVEESI